MVKLQYSERKKGIVALFVLVIIWGILPIIPRFLSIDFKLFQQVYLRMSIGLILSLLIFSKNINLKKIILTPKKDLFLILFRATFYYLVGVVLNTQALLLTKISNVTLIGALPITSLLGFIVLKEKFSVKKFILVCLAFFGVLIVSINNFSNFSFGYGELLALLSSLCISLALISRKWQSKFLNDQETTILILSISAVEIFFASIIKGEGIPNTTWSFSIVGFLVLGGILNAGTSFFSNYGFARVDAVLSGNILMLEPILASIFAFIIFNEIPVPKEIFGGIIILFSVIMMNRIENKQLKNA